MAARMSDSDERKIKQYSNLYDSYQKSGNQEGMDAAHRAAEEIRSQYGYSGGADGSQRISLATPKQTAAQQSKTSWTKVDKDIIDNPAVLDKIDNYSRLYKIAQDSGNQTLANMWHNAAEAERAPYGYSGGRYGAEYIPLNQYGTFTKNEKPEYSSRYDKSIQNQLQDILGSSYADWSQGDDYKYLQNQYAQAGQDAMQNTMAQLAAGPAAWPPATRRRQGSRHTTTIWASWRRRRGRCMQTKWPSGAESGPYDGFGEHGLQPLSRPAEPV